MQKSKGIWIIPEVTVHCTLRWKVVCGGNKRGKKANCLIIVLYIIKIIYNQKKSADETNHQNKNKNNNSFPHIYTRTQPSSAYLCNRQETLKLTKVKSAWEYCHSAPKELTVGTQMTTFTHKVHTQPASCNLKLFRSQILWTLVWHSLQNRYIFKAHDCKWPFYIFFCFFLTCFQIVWMSKQPEALWFFLAGAPRCGLGCGAVLCLDLLLFLDAVSHFGAVVKPLNRSYHLITSIFLPLSPSLCSM